MDWNKQMREVRTELERASIAMHVMDGATERIEDNSAKRSLLVISRCLTKLNASIKTAKLRNQGVPDEVYSLRLKLRRAAKALNRRFEPKQQAMMEGDPS